MPEPQKIVSSPPVNHGVRTVRVDNGGAGGGNISREGRYARLDEPKAEIRRCGRCGKDAVIVCQAWVQSFNGAQTGAITRDCRCQACGADVTLYDPSGIRTAKIIGWILVITVFMSPFIFFMVWRRTRAWDRNPLVPGAPRPPITSWRGPGNRRCAACGGIARLVNVTKRSHNGVPMGVECDFECVGCRRAFSTESAWGIIATLLAAALFGIGCVAMLMSDKKMEIWLRGLLVLCAVAGPFLAWKSTKKVIAAIRNPKLSGSDAVA